MLHPIRLSGAAVLAHKSVSILSELDYVPASGSGIIVMELSSIFHLFSHNTIAAEARFALGYCRKEISILAIFQACCSLCT